MAITIDRRYRSDLHPFHAVLLAGALPLFLGAMLSDIAYARSYQIQWTNFASWLLAGALVVSAGALLWALVGLSRGRRGGRWLAYVLVVAATWVLGFVDALVHARDAWATMPTGLVLSVIVAALACVATWLGHTGDRTGGAP